MHARFELPPRMSEHTALGRSRRNAAGERVEVIAEARDRRRQR
jgi:hypothetical protein